MDIDGGPVVATSGGAEEMPPGLTKIEQMRWKRDMKAKKNALPPAPPTGRVFQSTRVVGSRLVGSEIGVLPGHTELGASRPADSAGGQVRGSAVVRVTGDIMHRLMKAARLIMPDLDNLQALQQAALGVGRYRCGKDG